MELKIIIYSALLVAGALAICFVIFATLLILLIILLISPLKNLKEFLRWWSKKWNNYSSGEQSLIIVVGSIILAVILVSAYHGFYYFTSDVSPVEEHLHEEALSNIRSNIILFVVALFSICLAVWARVVSQEQLEISIKTNRNDRFAKAAEMLNNTRNNNTRNNNNRDRSLARGGIYILQDLVLESPKTEYIRCVEIISYWMVSYFQLKYKEGDADKRSAADKSFDRRLSNAAAKILKIRSDHEELENIIIKYKKANNLGHWPFLTSANLNKTFLRYANLQGASLANADLREANLLDVNLEGARLRRAKLDGANLTNANMMDIDDLSKEQISSAKWFVDDENGNSDGNPPELPDRLMGYKKVRKWCLRDANGKFANSKNLQPKNKS